MKLTFYVLCIYLIGIYSMANGQISGKIYQDNNGDGQISSSEKGLADIMVKAFDRKNQVITQTTTDSLGNYLLNITSGKRVRIELENLPDGIFSSPSGPFNSPMVQFVQSPKPANNIGLHYPSNYDNGVSRVAAVSYTIGNAKDSWGDTATAVTIFMAKTLKDKYKLAKMSDVGSVWGLAYDKNRERLYISSFAKRHVGYGKLGPSGIYMMDFTTGKLNPFVQNGAGLGIDAGEDKHTGLAGVFMNGNPYSNIDSVFFDQVGKVSFGGIDVSEDGHTLFVMNLKTRQLVQITVPQGDTKLTSSDISFINFPTLSTSEGELRPFAVKVFGNKVYVGAIFDASKSQKVSDLKAIIYEVDLATKLMKEVFSMPLDYQKGYPEVGYSSKNGWYPWTDDFDKGLVAESNGIWAIYPQPILSDIEFDLDGSMVLGFMDRFGHQGAGLARKNNPGVASLVECGGDIIRVALVKGQFQVENNGKAGSIVTKGSNNKQGPGGGEYYFEDFFAPDLNNIISEESAAGGLAIHPSTGELLASHREPALYNKGYTLQGIRYYNNKTGGYSRYIALASAGFQKSNGTGDVELIVDAPTTEIGNRVWFDCNENGLQDSDEKPVKGLTIDLYLNGVRVGTTQTNTNGEYYFKDDNVANGIEIGTEYQIKIPLNQSIYQGLLLTKTKEGKNSEIDNDAFVLDKTYAVIQTILKGAGQNNYSLDFGFRCQELPQATLSVSCTGNTETRDIKIGIKSFNSNDKYDVSKGDSYQGDMEYETAKPIPSSGNIFTDKINLYTTSSFTLRLFNQNCFSDFIVKTENYKECYETVLAVEAPEKEENGVILYPNPANSVIYIDYIESEYGDITVELVDISGRIIQSKIMRKSTEKYSTNFDITGLAGGTYFVRVKGNNATVSKKFSKN